jgi:glyceraldehyde 3-phosphate dehydrogenase
MSSKNRPIKIGINGFGRIGRTVLRIIAERDDIQIVAINDIAAADKLAYLTKYDTVMGTFAGNVELKGDVLHASKHAMKIFSSADPATIAWEKAGAEIVVEASGRFTKKADCEKHFSGGAKKVLLTVPAKDDVDITLVMGVNDDQLQASHRIISNASCTTNCLAPIAKILDESFGIEKGFMTTVHAYTNDQRLSDYAHKDLRRARGANDNIIPTTTGAAKTVGKVLPKMLGRLDGLAMRVPVANGSAIDFVVMLSKPTTVAQINEAVKKAAYGALKGIVQYTDEPLVSSDIIGNSHSAIYDAQSTMLMGKTYAKVFAWYDNEWGYSCRLVNVLEKLAAF